MEYLGTRDFITLRRASLISDTDRRLVTELYQPLIGHKGLALFITLDAFHDLLNSGEPWLVGSLSAHTQLTLSDLSIAKAALEAVGLLKSYVIARADYREHILELFAPKSPLEFFDDVVLSGMMNQYIGAAETQKLRLHYRAPAPHDEAQETTASFGEMFHPDFSNPLYQTKNDVILLGRVARQPESQFDRRAFLDEILKKSAWKKELFNNDLLDEIDRLANLYGIDELAMVELTLATIDEGGHIDFVRLRDLAALETRFAFSKTRKRTASKVTSSSSKAQKIKLMEETDPKTYFRYRNLNNAPAPADLKLISDIEAQYHMPFSVINALIDYVLETANMTFPRPLVEKIAASLVRSGATSAIDAMEYLLKTTRKKKVTPKVEPEENGEKPLVNEDKGEDIDVAALFATKGQGGQ